MQILETLETLETLEFFGQIFSKDGCQPDPKRIKALRNASKLTNVSEVRSLLGMANNRSKYIPNFATITAPVRDLTKKNTTFVWNKTHENAFKQLIEALSSAFISGINEDTYTRKIH